MVKDVDITVSRDEYAIIPEDCLHTIFLPSGSTYVFGLVKGAWPSHKQIRKCHITKERALDLTHQVCILTLFYVFFHELLRISF